MAEVEVWEQGVGAGSPGNTLTRQARPRKSVWRRIEDKWGDVQIESQDHFSRPSRVTLSPIACPSVSDSIADRELAAEISVGRVDRQLGLLGTVTPGRTHTKLVKLSVGLSAVFLGICLLAADKIGFPVPLMMQLAPIPVAIVNPIMTFLVLGSVLFAKTSPLKPHADRFHRFILSILALGGAFPIYKLLYQQIPEGYRGVAVVILPIWKFAAKRFMVGNTRRLEDIMPLAVAFCVDFLSTLFIAVFNIGQSLLEFRAMSANGKALFKLLDERRNSRTLIRKKFDSLDTTSLLVIILEAMHNSASLPPKSLKRVRLWACLRYPLTTERLELLHTLDASGVYRHEDATTGRSADQEHHHVSLQRHEYQHIRSASITPHSGEDKSANLHSDPGTEATTRHNQRLNKIVVQGVRLLFHAEYVALVQYVEAMVPIVFLIYKSVLEHLPNVVYYPGGASAWDLQSTSNTALLAYELEHFGKYCVVRLENPGILVLRATSSFVAYVYPAKITPTIAKQGIKSEATTVDSGRTEGVDDSSFGGG
ncbi:hypothetical protein ON010_g3536 [Phytophthora cinnamomi]|nr:hypothetical protein ON010_g3536 [Phytophthora cinnamomi]